MIGLSILVGGVRFSDGGALLAVASGSGPGSEFFRDSVVQYVWDSPLRVAFLRILPPTAIAISVAFLAVAALPLVGLLFRHSRLFFLTGILLMATPAIKISFQNVGVGDGLTYLLTVLAVATKSHRSLFVLFLLMGAWHPQHAFFIYGSYAVFGLAFKEPDYKKRLLGAGTGSLLAFLLFLAHRASLGATYFSRIDYLARNGLDLLVEHLPMLPIILFWPVLWVVLILRCCPKTRVPAYGYLWLAALALLALATADVTRVLSVIALPMILIPMKQAYSRHTEARSREPVRLPLLLVGLAICMPVVSWSGIEIFLWPDLLHDLCKYGVFCR